MAAERAGGRTQLTSIIAAGLTLLTGAFLAPLFSDLPQATLGAIVVVAVAGFFRFSELARFSRLRRSAFVLALIALIGVLVFGILPGLLVATGISLAVVVQRLSRPSVVRLARDPVTGVWGRADRHDDWQTTDGFMVARVEGPLFYANAMAVKGQLLVMARETEPKPKVLVLDLAESPGLVVDSLDVLAELASALAAMGIELRLASVHFPGRELLRRAGFTDQVRMEPTDDSALHNRAPQSSD
jgi:SulP family sulfate permease